ncbi:MAG: phospho-2-dehydro-3-deoxyheptonate aldolase [Thermoleophilia bacterium]|nr:phospho-2-dehydro-3-deoxyheptonate aldolase [Thermoleophilia bacterium]
MSRSTSSEATVQLELERHPYRNAVRNGRPDTVVHVGEARIPIGGGAVAVIAGPCAVEGRDTLLATARALSGLGVRMLRGGAFKPRTSPHSFQGLGHEGLELLAEARELTGMAIVTEVLSPEEVPLVARYADVLQVGTRNMANYRLLQALGDCGRPVLLKRGMAATVEELLCAAEYVLAAGNPDVILCERGIRSFEPLVRNAFDLNVIPLLAELTHLPVIVDPSHAAGRVDLVHGVSLGAVAAGAHGLIVEVHEQPGAALVDGGQSLDLAGAARLLDGVDAVAGAIGRRLDRAAHTVAA